MSYCLIVSYYVWVLFYTINILLSTPILVSVLSYFWKRIVMEFHFNQFKYDLSNRRRYKWSTEKRIHRLRIRDTLNTIRHAIFPLQSSGYFVTVSSKQQNSTRGIRRTTYVTSHNLGHGHRTIIRSPAAERAGSSSAYRNRVLRTFRSYRLVRTTDSSDPR